MIAAQKLDPRFARDAKFPNQWRPLTRKPTGGFAEGDAQPYGGMGQYVKVTALVDADGKPNGKLFIEAHMVFHEPQGWFGGANLLGSKLPLAVQDNVREFRRLLRQNSSRLRQPNGVPMPLCQNVAQCLRTMCCCLVWLGWSAVGRFSPGEQIAARRSAEARPARFGLAGLPIGRFPARCDAETARLDRAGYDRGEESSAGLESRDPGGLHARRLPGTCKRPRAWP